MDIRAAAKKDESNIKALYLDAFPESENELVAQLAIELLHEKSEPECISLLAENASKLMGHISFSPVFFKDCQGVNAYILAPLAVCPEQHKKGIGSKLIQAGIAHLSERKANLLFVYGDPGYYGRFGFQTDLASQFAAPCPLEYPFGWQAMFFEGFQRPASAHTITCVPPLQNPKLW